MAGAGRIAAPLELLEQAAPGTPGTGVVALYALADGKVYIKDDVGTQTDLTAVGAGGGAADTFVTRAKWMTD